MPFKKGEGGRPKGVENKATREIKDAARKLLEAKTYQDSLRERLEAGKAPHMEALLHYYAYGKPKERVAIEGGPVPLVLDMVTNRKQLEDADDEDDADDE